MFSGLSYIEFWFVYRSSKETPLSFPFMMSIVRNLGHVRVVNGQEYFHVP